MLGAKFQCFFADNIFHWTELLLLVRNTELISTNWIGCAVSSISARQTVIICLILIYVKLRL